LEKRKKKNKKMARRSRPEDVSMSDADVSEGEEERAMDEKYRKQEEARQKKAKKRSAAALEEDDDEDENGDDNMKIQGQEDENPEEERERKRLRILLAADVEGFLGFPQEIQNIIIDMVRRSRNLYLGQNKEDKIGSVLTAMGMTSQVMAERARAYMSQTFHALVRRVRTEFGRHGRYAIGIWHTLMFDLISFLKQSKLRAYPLMVRFLDRRLEFPSLTVEQMGALFGEDAWSTSDEWVHEGRLALLRALVGEEGHDKDSKTHYSALLRSTLAELRLVHPSHMHYMHVLVYLLKVLDESLEKYSTATSVGKKAIKIVIKAWRRHDPAQFFTFGGLLLVSRFDGARFFCVRFFWDEMVQYTMEGEEGTMQHIVDANEDEDSMLREIRLNLENFYSGEYFRRDSYDHDPFEKLERVVQTHGTRMGVYTTAALSTKDLFKYQKQKKYAAWFWLIPDIQTYAQIALDAGGDNIMHLGYFYLNVDDRNLRKTFLKSLATMPYEPGEVPPNQRHWSDVLIPPKALETERLQDAYLMAQSDKWPQALRYLFADGAYFHEVHMEMMKRVFRGKDYHHGVVGRLKVYLPLDAPWETIASRLAHIPPLELEENDHMAVLLGYLVTMEHMDWDNLWTIPSSDTQYLSVFDLQRNDYAQLRALLLYAGRHPNLVRLLAKDEGGQGFPAKADRHGILTKKLALDLFEQNIRQYDNPNPIRLIEAYAILAPQRFFYPSPQGTRDGGDEVTMTDYIKVIVQHGSNLWEGTRGDRITGHSVTTLAEEILELHERHGVPFTGAFVWPYPRMPMYNIRCLARRWLSVWLVMMVRLAFFPHNPAKDIEEYHTLPLEKIEWPEIFEAMELCSGSFEATCITLLDFCFFTEHSIFQRMTTEAKGNIWKSFWTNGRDFSPKQRQFGMSLLLHTLQHEGNRPQEPIKKIAYASEDTGIPRLIEVYVIPLLSSSSSSSLSPDGVQDQGDEEISWLDWIERYDLGTVLFWGPRLPENFEAHRQSSFLKTLYTTLREKRYPHWDATMPYETTSFF
jgi:hypothetical protein